MAYGVKTQRNAEVNIAADDVVIDVKNQADKATAETYGLLVEAGSSGYERDSSISISNANTVKISAVSSGASAIKTAAIRGKIGSGSGTAIINLAAKDIQLTAAGSEAAGVEVVYGGKVNIGNENSPIRLRLPRSMLQPKPTYPSQMSLRACRLTARMRMTYQKLI